MLPRSTCSAAVGAARRRGRKTAADNSRPRRSCLPAARPGGPDDWNLAEVLGTIMGQNLLSHAIPLQYHEPLSMLQRWGGEEGVYTLIEQEAWFLVVYLHRLDFYGTFDIWCFVFTRCRLRTTLYTVISTGTRLNIFVVYYFYMDPGTRLFPECYFVSRFWLFLFR